MKPNIIWCLALLLCQLSLTLSSRASQCNHLKWPQKPFCIKYPLHWAATLNNVTEVEQILANGAHIDEKTERGYTGNTALHIASRYGRAEVVRTLIRNGADGTMRNKNGEFPMDRARIKFCQWNPKNTWCALGDSDYAATFTLLQYGCGTAGCAAGLSCVANRCLRQHTHAIAQNSRGISRHNWNSRKIRGACGAQTWFWWSEQRCQKYPFHWAAVAGDNTKVANYLRDGTDVDLRDGDRYTPLMLAAWAGRAGTVSLLLHHGADHSLTNVRGRSALLLASKTFCRDPNSNGCRLGRVDYDKTMSLLREGCATLKCMKGLHCIAGTCKKWETPDRFQIDLHKRCGPHIWADWSDQRCEEYPFHWAALIGNNDEVTRFLDMRIEVDLRDGVEYGYTPMMHAAWAGHASTVKLLLSYGADASLTNVRGHTSLDLANKQFCRDSWKGCKLGKVDYDETIRILGREVHTDTRPGSGTLTVSGAPCVRFLLHGTWYEANNCKCCWNSKPWCATSTTEQGYTKHWDYCNTDNQ